MGRSVQLAIKTTREMRVVHINRSDARGGASLAASRIVQAQRGIGIDAKLLVGEKLTKAEWVVSIADSPVRKLQLTANFLRDLAAFYPHERNRLERFAFSPALAGFDLSRHPLVGEADIIHLHWFNQGFMSVKGLAKIFSLGKPVVWTLHDMWSFTGGCHYSGECESYTIKCGNCPKIIDPAKKDISFTQHKRKKKIYKHAPLSIVTCSKWLGSLAKESSLLRKHPVSSIPNPIDTELYSPCSRSEARERLSIPDDKKIILFGAANVADPRKGMPLLLHALRKMAKGRHASSIRLVIFGKIPANIEEELPFPSHLMHYINDPKVLADLYNSADLFVLPSLEDNLPNTVMEALACGTPVAAFRIGGVPEMVAHGICGYLATPGSAEGLAEGMEHLLFNPDAEDYRRRSREKVRSNFAPELVARRYQELYLSLHEGKMIENA